ncbi:Ribonuclease BN, tRNA processing enzyme [Paenibacillus sophorae]|uniref:MBL fold metallo-hydrolase n=1 Tax=Paenibacillus sophorae TaxID=1333845 RepID=A0A1H8JP77_9BACL|nr:MBL fold metallo-hydrolase [Paenibacillus sophorae]QWU13436.1 MBL fold metallo-hydrolase [Paenibacillus sophorae]SEN82482.1 Ribonuclease BN, tRNA processing enzyme [Paenibacillus sophorae]
MTVKLQMLGTGSAFAKNYFNNNALLMGSGYTLLIDCGITAPLAMHELGRSFGEVEATLITHLHADHVGGLEELALTLRYKTGRKMTLLLPEALVDPLWEHTLMGGLYQEGIITSLDDAFHVRPLKPDTVYTLSPEITVRLIRTPHIPGKDSYSLMLNEEVFYSADMTFEPELLISLVRSGGCRKIYHDCQLEGAGVVHTTLEELKSLPEDIRSRISLMHYGDEKPDYVGRTSGMDFLEQHVVYYL